MHGFIELIDYFPISYVGTKCMGNKHFEKAAQQLLFGGNDKVLSQTDCTVHTPNISELIQIAWNWQDVNSIGDPILSLVFDAKSQEALSHSLEASFHTGGVGHKNMADKN